MITAIQITAVILIALLVGSLFYYGFRRRGPWGTFWSFILIIFLGVLLFDVYADPVGPIYYGIAWFDLIVIGILFAFLLGAAGRRYPKDPATEPETADAGGAAIAIGYFFWGLVIFFLLAIFFRIFF